MYKIENSLGDVRNVVEEQDVIDLIGMLEIDAKIKNLQDLLNAYSRSEYPSEMAAYGVCQQQGLNSRWSMFSLEDDVSWAAIQNRTNLPLVLRTSSSTKDGVLFDAGSLSSFYFYRQPDDNGVRVSFKCATSGGSNYFGSWRGRDFSMQLPSDGLLHHIKWSFYPIWGSYVISYFKVVITDATFDPATFDHTGTSVKYIN